MLEGRHGLLKGINLIDDGVDAVERGAWRDCDTTNDSLPESTSNGLAGLHLADIHQRVLGSQCSDRQVSSSEHLSAA